MRVVLEGVPRVGFYHDQRQHADSNMRCPENVPFPSVMRACMEYLGDGIGCKRIGLANASFGVSCAYAYLMGTTGAAFRLSWKPGWHGDNVGSFLVSDDPSEIFRRGFASVGRDCDIVCRAELREQGRDSMELVRDKIVESIRDWRRPVIAHGVVGPPEESIIAGYDEDGDVLIGWSFFQGFPDCNAGLEFEPCGYFRKRNWDHDVWSIVRIGEETELAPLGERYRTALGWALDVVRTPKRYGDRHNGLAAYDAWADHLLLDDEFASDDEEALALRFGVHDDAVSTVAEGRWYASLYLSQMAAEGTKGASELLAAASCYVQEHDLMWKVWGLVGGLGRSPEKIRKLAEPDVRRQAAAIIRESRDLDERAAAHVERALDA